MDYAPQESHLKPGLQQNDTRLSCANGGSMLVGDYAGRIINLLAEPLNARTHGNYLASN